ncbi:MAG: serine/threonine protein kinase [Acidobacteria bacterium]|nr:MAG: serine/threonine protein kinase [Acidobacteriota bacterium]
MAARDRSDLFFRLTPEKVLAAVEAAGLEVTGVCYPLNSFENRVYEVELVDKSRVVAKFYRPGRWRPEQILEEHAFLAELAAEEIPVCNVRPFPDGSTLKRIEGIYYSLSDRQGGRAPDELDDALARRLGMFVARMHNVAVRRPAAEVDRPPLDAERYVRAPLAFLLERRVIPAHLAGRYAAAAEAIAAIAEQRMAAVAVHRIHADLHLGNVLLRDGLLRVLDFDDMAIGPAVQDLWLAIPGRDGDSLRRRRRMIEGYEELRLFDHSTLNLIEPLRGLRLVRYAGWLARRWDDPAFKAGWPHFGTGDYWRQETEDLEQQLAVIRDEAPPSTDGTPNGAAARADEPELTNKDFFWDWEGD